ncbi:MAG TPA: hypothetical protein PKE65_07835 [Rhizobiaceae bacterium]|nr:hypothetical protein [Rhizobiaceae bacterium]
MTLVWQAMTFGLLLLALAALLAPYESLAWWAGWFGHTPDATRPAGSAPPGQERPDRAEPQCHVVLLLGINTVSVNTRSDAEREFISALREALPDCEVVDDVFPYSPFGAPLTGDRLLAWLWRAVSQLGGRFAVGLLRNAVNIRNLMQFLVSTDSRYGPIYNFGVAQVMIDALMRHGYSPGAPRPVILLGYSGGAQICVGAAPYMEAAIGRRPSVIALGGVISADPGLDSLETLVRLQGGRDRVPGFGALFFPGLWPVAFYSYWNRALRAGRIRTVVTGRMAHTGKGGYLDREARDVSGRSHLQTTVALIEEEVRRIADMPVNGRVRERPHLRNENGRH